MRSGSDDRLGLVHPLPLPLSLKVADTQVVEDAYRETLGATAYRTGMGMRPVFAAPGRIAFADA